MPITVDPSKAILTVGTHIVQGYTDGTMISVEYDDPDEYKHKVGGQGEVVRVKNMNRMGKVMINLLPGVESNKILTVMAAVGATFPVLFEDLATGSVAKGTGWISNRPKLEAQSQDAPQRDWIITIEKLDTKVG